MKRYELVEKVVATYDEWLAYAAKGLPSSKENLATHILYAVFYALEDQEPVAWMYVNEDGECEQIEYGEIFDDPHVTPLFAAPASDGLKAECERLREVLAVVRMSSGYQFMASETRSLISAALNAAASPLAPEGGRE